MRIGLAGTGAMGENHVKVLAKIEGVEVISVAGRTEDGVKEFAGKWNIPHSSTNLETCIDRPGVAVILAMPSDQLTTRP
jgi:2-hydroxy-4-carboxymuconate semialdehyde hemiacetal dehydrogenase